jgi:hypothetical protein
MNFRPASGILAGLIPLAALLLAEPGAAATVNYIEGVWATSGGTNPAYVATGTDLRYAGLVLR